MEPGALALFLCLCVAASNTQVSPIQDLESHPENKWYTTSDYSSCGRTLTNSFGDFSSPNYPYNYPNSQFCEWRISVANAQRIVLAFTAMELEMSCCGCDTVSVYDGLTTSSRLLASFCQGNGRGKTIRSSSKSMLVVFRADSSITGRGFNAVYNIGQYSCRYNCGYSVGSCSCSSSCQYHGDCCPDFCDYCTYTNYDYCYNSTSYPTTDFPVSDTSHHGRSCRYYCGSHLGTCSCSSSCYYYGDCCPDYSYYCGTTPQPSTTVPTCGGSLYYSGSFSSPNYPSNYHNNAYCQWDLTASSGQRVFLTFNHLGLETCCGCDYISVYDGPSPNYALLGALCFNSTLTSFHSSGSYMTVVFRSDGSVTNRGFQATFSSSLPAHKGKVECSSNRMSIILGASYLSSLGYSGYDLYLNDKYCRPQVSYSQVVFTFPVNTCGSQRKLSNGQVIYTNDVWAPHNASSEITHRSELHLRVGCYMDQKTMAHIMYMVNDYSANITGTGQFNATMTFYTSSYFQFPITVSPYVVGINSYLYVQVELTGDVNSLVLFLDTCVASPSSYDFVTRSYDLLRNGCVKDNTYYSYHSPYSYIARFRFTAFKFLRSHSSVYLQCKVVVCQAYDSYSRCSQGCLSRKARSLGSAPAYGETTVVLGPIQLQDFKNPQKTLEEVVETKA